MWNKLLRDKYEVTIFVTMLSFDIDVMVNFKLGKYMRKSTVSVTE